MKITSDKEADEVKLEINRLNVLENQGYVLNAIEERDRKYWSDMIREYDGKRRSEVEAGCQVDLIGQTVYGMMKTLLDAGLNPIDQNRVLNNVRARMVGEWHELGRTSERERLERESSEKKLRSLIEQQDPKEK